MRADGHLRKLRPVCILLGLIVMLLLTAMPSSAASAQESTTTNAVAFQDFGWDPDTKGASGSATYGGVGGSFAADIEVEDLKPSHT